MLSFTHLLWASTVLLSMAISEVKCHGFVEQVLIGGKWYPGWNPNTDPYAEPPVSRVIRKIPNDGPVTNVDDPSLACNVGGETGAGLVAKATAGSSVIFQMLSWPDDHLGPVSHYMASCDGDCTRFDTSNAKWFKLDAAGYSNGVWASTELIKNNFSATATIPAALKSGQYLIRHEIVALHDATQPQFYPACAQVEVTGSGSQTPPTSDLVSIPGLYDHTQWPDIWSDSFKSFTIPGPPVAFGASGTNNVAPSPPAAPPANASNGNSQASPATSFVRPTTVSSSLVSAASAAPTGKCRSRMVKRRAATKRLTGHAAVNAKRHH